ncbi:MAG: aminopeptidase P N-terminal domain-containing protein [Tepidisphaeraceae bacterium]
MIEPKEFARRRQELSKEIGKSVALIFAGENTGHGKFTPDPNFNYLTGLTSEPGAVLMLDPSNEIADRRVVLFLKPMNNETERWDGYRPPINAALKEATGIKTILRTGALPANATAALRRTKQAACVLPFAVYPAPASADLNVFQQVAARVPGVRIDDKTTLLNNQRAIKSPAEIKLIEQAARITEAAYAQMIPHIRPGLNEGQLQLALETVYKQMGGDIAYGTIVGSGLNGTVLHYIANDQPLQAGDLMVIDSAASFGGYASDITRTFPVSGTFTPDQRELYEVVLAAELAAIKAAKPGVSLFELDQVARHVITKAGFGDAFIHSVGHPLGLTVHDVVPDHPLKPGMVITIEPGIYLPDRKIGIRIEDDLLITRSGNRNLTPNVPKTVKEIESAMKR